MSALLLSWIWFSVVVFLACCLWRALKYARMPVHLRWDLYPVAHEPRQRREHGGSYLEEKDWWTKKHETSLWGEVSAMGAEILLLEGVRENNRKLWWASLPFHWGLYVLSMVTIGLLISAFGLTHELWVRLLAVGGIVGGGLTTIGALGLFWIRSTDPKFKHYTSPLDRLNLLLLTVLGGLCVAVAVAPAGMLHAAKATASLVRLQAPAVSPLLGAQMAVAALFLLYMPFTRMVHFFSKYFTYHQVRWDDRPMVAGSKMEKRLQAALNFGVAWSAEHVKTGKTWGEVATRVPEDLERKDGE